MLNEFVIYNKSDDEFLGKLLSLSEQFSNFCLLNSNSYSKDKYSNFQLMVGIGADDLLVADNNSIDALQKFHSDSNSIIFGFLSYDIKNEIEDLYSKNFDGLEFPNVNFFKPKVIITQIENEISIKASKPEYNSLAENIFLFLNSNEKFYFDKAAPKINLKQRISENEYLKSVNKLKEYIQYGDIFEANFCLEFFDNNAEINPAELYLKLNKNSPSPFSAFYKLNDKFIISSSPERYLQRKENRLISQPIKGTIKRGKTEEEDKKLVNQLKNDEKELSENKMIVDLVRNDLSRTALKSSVKVVELCEIYTFNQLHQMISTIESKVSADTNFSEIIKSSFPMGSMTGAPKVRAMQLIEEYEKTKREAYSGSVGYIDKNGDFDFNVVIRSVLYNQSNKYLSYITGSAITRLSSAEEEYKECQLKAQALYEILGG